MGSSGGEMSNGISVDANTCIYTTGNFQNTVDFDPGAGVSNLTSLGSSDIFVQKLSTCTLTPVQPGAVSGLTVMCAGAGAQVYSIAPVGGASSYAWNLPGGWSGSSNNNTISATPGSSGIFSVAATNSCGTGPSQTLSVTVNPLPNVSASAPGTVCSGAVACFTANGATSYTWTGPCGFNSNSVTPCIQVFSNCACGYTLAGTTNGCTKSTTLCLTTVPWPTVSIAPKVDTICAGQSLTLTASGAANYTWYPGPLMGNSIVISPTVSNMYVANGANNFNCSAQDTAFIFVNICTGIQKNSASMSELKVYPNPAEHYVTVSKATGGKSELNLYNSLGELLMQRLIFEEETKLNLEHLPAGIYLLKIKSEGKETHFRILKE
jgi:hypothetical protein